MSISTFLRDTFPRLYRRKIHVYSIGAAKTGTTSIASMFRPAFRSAHEEDIEVFNRQLIRYLEGQIDKNAMAEFLIERDQRLNLDIESSHPMGYVSDILVNRFPNAKFIITIREPYSLLRSRLNFHHRVDPPEWREYRNYFWKRLHKGFNEQEKVLEKYGVCSLDIYLSQYADHYRKVLKEVPEERRLIIKTQDLNTSIENIADFLEIDKNLIHESHSNRESDKIQPLKEMDDNYVRSKIWMHCEELIREYFPETLDSYSNAETA